MKKAYIQPQTDAILLAPSREMMDRITLPTSEGGPTVGGTAPARGQKVTILYV